MENLKKRNIGYSVQEVADMLGYSYSAVANNTKDIRNGRSMSISHKDIKTIKARLEANKRKPNYPYKKEKERDINKIRENMSMLFFSNPFKE